MREAAVARRRASSECDELRDDLSDDASSRSDADVRDEPSAVAAGADSMPVILIRLGDSIRFD